MRSASRHKCAALLAAGLVAAACSTPAPPLPPDQTRRDAALPGERFACDPILRDIARIDGELQAANQRIAAQAPRNQALGYYAGVLMAPFLLAATEENAEERAAVTRLYRERDALLARGTELGCPMPR